MTDAAQPRQMGRRAAIGFGLLGAATALGTARAAASASSASLKQAASSGGSEVTGWASQGGGTTGGAGAAPECTYTVRTRAEFLAALANEGSPRFATDPAAARAEPKIINVEGTIDGTDLGNGRRTDLAYYQSRNATAARWDLDLYVKSVDPSYTPTDEERVKMKALSSARGTLQRLQKEQIQFSVPSNTSILGLGRDAKIVDGYLSINATSNIVVRNLAFEAPQDLGAAYNNTPGEEEWNARYDALTVVTGRQLWVDHCTFSDGAHLDDAEIRTINGVKLPVQRHDGLLDIEDGSDYVTVSSCVFTQHDKSNMVGGSGDGKGERERNYNRLTFSHNLWRDSTQRTPRVRFARAHVFNNYLTGSTDTPGYPVLYYLGMGVESRILSEANAFELSGPGAGIDRVISNLGGYQFHDSGSWYNGQRASAALEKAAKAALEAQYEKLIETGAARGFKVGPFTTDLGWKPPYPYRLGSSAAAVREQVLAGAGAGRVPGLSG